MTDGRTVAVSTSIGIATVTAPGLTAEQVLRNADTAMYRAKGDGRNRIEFFDEALHVQAQRRLALCVHSEESLSSVARLLVEHLRGPAASEDGA